MQILNNDGTAKMDANNKPIVQERFYREVQRLGTSMQTMISNAIVDADSKDGKFGIDEFDDTPDE